MNERQNSLRVTMNANVSTTPTELGLGPSLALVDSCSLQSPYLAAVDMLRMITDVASPSAKLNIIGMHICSSRIVVIVVVVVVVVVAVAVVVVLVLVVVVLVLILIEYLLKSTKRFLCFLFRSRFLRFLTFLYIFFQVFYF